MTRAVDFTTPGQAVCAMRDAGAVFTIRPRRDALGLSFTFHVGEDGDLARCRQILASVKTKPAAFFEAFKAHVQRAVASSDRGAA